MADFVYTRLCVSLLVVLACVHCSPQYLRQTRWSDSLEDHPSCGQHPVKTILDQLQHDSTGMVFSEAMVLLNQLRGANPKLWKLVQSKIANFNDCMIIANGGHFG